MASTLSNKLGKIGTSPIALKEFISLKQEINKLNHPARPDIDWKKVEDLCKTLLRKNGADLQTLSFYTIALTKLYGLKGLTEGIDYIDTLISKYWFNFWPEQTHVRVEIIAWLAKSIQQFLRSYQFSYADLTYIYTLEKLCDHLCQNFQDLEIKHLTGIMDLYQLISKTAKQLERLEQENTVKVISFEKNEINTQLYKENNSPKLTTQNNDQSQHKTVSKQSTDNNNHAEAVQSIPKKKNPEDNSPPIEQKSFKNNFWKGFASGALVMLIIGSIFGGITFYNNFTKLKEVPIANSHYFPTNLDDNQINILTRMAGNKLSKNITDNILVNGKETITQIELQPLWAFSYSNQLIKLYQSLFPNNVQVTKLSEQWQKKRQTLANQYVQTNAYQIIQNQLQNLMDRLNGLDERKGRYITVSELKSIVFSIQKPLLQFAPLDELLRQMKEQKTQGKDTIILQQQIDTRFLQLLNYYYVLQHSK